MQGVWLRFKLCLPGWLAPLGGWAPSTTLADVETKRSAMLCYAEVGTITSSNAQMNDWRVIGSWIGQLTILLAGLLDEPCLAFQNTLACWDKQTRGGVEGTM
jgi:hypothetical protein